MKHSATHAIRSIRDHHAEKHELETLVEVLGNRQAQAAVTRGRLGALVADEQRDHWKV